MLGPTFRATSEIDVRLQLSAPWRLGCVVPRAFFSSGEPARGSEAQAWPLTSESFAAVGSFRSRIRCVSTRAIEGVLASAALWSFAGAHGPAAAGLALSELFAEFAAGGVEEKFARVEPVRGARARE